VQFFQCGYAAVSGWPGWRALVTSDSGSQAWVDMPGPGPDAFLSDYAKGGELAAVPGHGLLSNWQGSVLS
jgi:hypothetical protein